jgi:Short C-terminal domain
MPGPRRRMRRRAVVGGAVVASHHANKVADEQAQADQQQDAAPPAAEPAGRSMDEKTADIEKLAELRDSGALTEEEFAQQKQQVLDS